MLNACVGAERGSLASFPQDCQMISSTRKCNQSCALKQRFLDFKGKVFIESSHLCKCTFLIARNHVGGYKDVIITITLILYISIRDRIKLIAFKGRTREVQTKIGKFEKHFSIRQRRVPRRLEQEVRAAPKGFAVPMTCRGQQRNPFVWSGRTVN